MKQQRLAATEDDVMVMCGMCTEPRQAIVSKTQVNMGVHLAFVNHIS